MSPGRPGRGGGRRESEREGWAAGAGPVGGWGLSRGGLGPPPVPHRSGEVPWRNKATVFPEKYTGSRSC